MSRLTDLLRQVRQSDGQLAKDLEAEIGELTDRRTFGLVFEPHHPEAVELPSRPVRRGEKVRILPPRGQMKAGDSRLWRVWRIDRQNGQCFAHLTEIGTDNSETKRIATEDLVVIAEFKDHIYPGLVESGRVERGGEKPFHTVINAENYHALEMLTYTHRHSIDAIYIDPPYNSGAKDWKYNNDYVESDDDYRHSKWLAFMERRLNIARELLNPDDSVLIVTIDEKEYLRLGMLLEQVFPEGSIQMVSTVINVGGSVRAGAFSRTDEYIYFVRLGDSQVSPLKLPEDWRGGRSTSSKPVLWRSMLRGGDASNRTDRPNMFYPVFVNIDGSGIHSIGDPILLEVNKDTVTAPEGTWAVWPINSRGREGRWRIGFETARANFERGFMRANYKKNGLTISYLADGIAKSIIAGDIEIIGREVTGEVKIGEIDNHTVIPGTTWSLTSHNSRDHGSQMIRKLITRQFPYPKSLYAVEDALRFFVVNKPEAVVLDFFSGSGTTAHAVMRLNKQDNGHRQCISVTNNEVSADEQRKLRKQGLRPGDQQWEERGICDYITKPRISAAITGQTPDGHPVEGEYRFTDEFPIADGLEENAAYFTLTYEAPLSVRHNRAFSRIAPMLWLRAGARDRIVTDLGEQGWDVTSSYAVLEDFDRADEFVNAVRAVEDVLTVYIITDDQSAFQMVCRSLPKLHTPVRLYESYLQNFEINTGGSL